MPDSWPSLTKVSTTQEGQKATQSRIPHPEVHMDYVWISSFDILSFIDDIFDRLPRATVPGLGNTRYQTFVMSLYLAHADIYFCS
jgi:hypothetical protein